MMSWTESLARRPVALLGTTAAMLLLPPVRSTPAAAQVVEGRVVEAEGGGAAAGVLMELTDLQGAVLTRDETDGDGAFSLTAPEPGDFLVLASALGFRTVRGGVFEVGAGGRIQIEIRLQVEPLGLDELTVEVAQGSRLSRAQAPRTDRPNRDHERGRRPGRPHAPAWGALHALVMSSMACGSTEGPMSLGAS